MPPPPTHLTDPIVIPKDGNRRNVALDNLEWAERSTAVRRGWERGHRPWHRNERVLTPEQELEIYTRYMAGETQDRATGRFEREPEAAETPEATR